MEYVVEQTAVLGKTGKHPTRYRSQLLVLGQVPESNLLYGPGDGTRYSELEIGIGITRQNILLSKPHWNQPELQPK